MRRGDACLRTVLTPEGLFLYDRDSGLCLFTPEKTSQTWEKPLYAQVALTTKCNLSCWYCYNSAPQEAEWEISALKRLVSFLDSWGVLGVSLGGGEPFLYPHLAEIARYTWEKTGLDATLTTNGTAASEGQIKSIEGCISEVRVSIHGVASLTYLRKFIHRKFEVGVNLLLFRVGVKPIESIVRQALKYGVNDFLINSFLATGRGGAYAHMQPIASDFAELAGLIRRYSHRATFKVSGRLAKELARHIDGFIPFQSEAPGRIIAVTADGEIKLSSLSEKAEPFSSPEEIPYAYRKLLEVVRLEA